MHEPDAKRRKRKRGGAVPGAASPSRLDKRGRGGSGIHIKESHEGRLHTSMGIPENKPIPMAKLEAEKESAGSAKKKQIVFAENAKKWHH